jgi:hypothetical protein
VRSYGDSAGLETLVLRREHGKVPAVIRVRPRLSVIVAVCRGGEEPRVASAVSGSCCRRSIGLR